MSQVVNTFWDERVERIGAAVKANPIVQKQVRARRLVDAIILTIILAAAATCISVYNRARAEFDLAIAKHQAAGEKVEDLTIKVQKLERDVKQIRTDSRVIELFARQKFGFIRSGDVVIRVAQDDEGETPGGVELRPARTERIANSERVANLTPRTGEVYTDASN